MSDLVSLREEINQITKEMVNLFEKRLDVSKKIALYKKQHDLPIFQPEREKEVIEKNLQVVDMTASILARDNKMPMWVFGLNEENSIVNTVNGKFTGTKVTV